MLPDADGLDLCRRIRQSSDIPILMPARGDAMDRVVGLESAPTTTCRNRSSRELLARLRHPCARRAIARVLRSGGSKSNAARAVPADGHDCMLTSHQFALLDALAGHAGRVMSRDALMDLLKGETAEAFDRSVDVHIRASAPPSRTTRRNRAASSRCAAPATCSRGNRIDAPPHLQII